MANQVLRVDSFQIGTITALLDNATLTGACDPQLATPNHCLAPPTCFCATLKRVVKRAIHNVSLSLPLHACLPVSVSVSACLCLSLCRSIPLSPSDGLQARNLSALVAGDNVWRRIRVTLTP